MKYEELFEGTTPKLPGAPPGVKVMSIQQFVAKSKEEDVTEGTDTKFVVTYYNNLSDDTRTVLVSADDEYDAKDKINYALGRGSIITGVRPAKGNEPTDQVYKVYGDPRSKVGSPGIYDRGQGVAEGSGGAKYKIKSIGKDKNGDYYISPNTGKKVYKNAKVGDHETPRGEVKPKVAEATKLPAPSREFGDEEFQKYMGRIAGQEKEKTDKYKLPYIHRSSVVKYLDKDGKRYREDDIKQALAVRPDKILKKNEKMKHSDGAEEQFFNVGFAALVGIALDETTNNLIVVNTCPGAGSCKVDCFAMKGGFVQFEAAWLSRARMLTYLLNDPDGFFSQLDSEIKREVNKGKKAGYNVTIRWHDSGDFFSPEYVGLAYKLAEANPDVKFYAYTKVADVVLGKKPDNFLINWSEGAHTSQEKKVKAQDPSLETTKNSRIVPTNLFGDLLVKDEKKNLVKGPQGQWQVIPDKIPELKQRLAKEYGISANSILTYDEWDTKGRKNPQMKWNVIITPGEPDLTARDPGVLSTLLLKH